VGTVVLGASQAAAGNYTAATASTSFTVSAAPPTLAFTAIAAQTYGVAPFTVSASSASSGAITYSVTSGPATISGSTVTITGVGTVVLGASQTAAGNYTAATASTSFTVSAAPPTLAFSAIAAQTYGVAPFTVSASSASSGAVTYSVTSGPATISGSTVTISGVGTVVLGASQAAAGNYTAATASTSFTVSAAPLTLPSAGNISTVAGGGTVCAGKTDSVGDGCLATSATLHYPYGVAVDSAGNLFIADGYNNRIRMVSASTGDITTVAGNGTQGYSGDGGAATSAELNRPYGVTLDSSGNLYIAEWGNNVIRKVTVPIATGTISTVAGNGTASYTGDGGLATSAELYMPEGVVVDSSGNIYIADTANNRVRMVAASTANGFTAGDIYTVAGGGTACAGKTDSIGDGCLATSATLYQPTSLAFDSSGNLYIADPGDNRVRKVTTPSIPTTATITTVVGNGTNGYSGDGGPATSAAMYWPDAIAVDGSNNIYVLSGRTSGANNAANCGLRKVVAATGYIYTVGGNGTCGYSGDGGMATSAELAPGYSVGVAVDSLGNLYIADESNQRIRVVGASSNLTPTITWPAPSAITYGTALSATQLDAVASANGGPATTCVYTPALGTVLAAGTQALSVTCTPTGTTVYSPATATVSLTVNKAPLTITASSAAVAYGAAVPTITPSYSGFVNGDTSASLTTQPTCNTTYTLSSAAGSSPSTSCTGAVDANYSISYVNGAVTVNSDATITSLSPTSAARSASVTITGTNFNALQGSSTVTFNGIAATSISSWSATQIVTVVPSDATTGNVVVTAGGVLSNGVAFTVLIPPTITRLSPTSAAVGASVTITGTNFNTLQGSSTVTFNGIAATSISSWNPTQIVAVVPSGATTGNVVVTVNGIASAGSAFTVLLSITTVSLPTGVQNASYSTTLQAGGGQPPYTWTHSGNLPSGLQLSTNGAITGTPIWSGTDSFTVRVTDSAQTSANEGMSISVNAVAPPSSTGSVAYTYDSQGRVWTATYTTSSGTVTVTYSYDNAGNRTSVVTQ
jgi:hypothetical protein